MAAVARSLAFYIAYYCASAFLVVIALIAIMGNGAGMQRCARLWAAAHRWCLRNLLGITIRVEGKPSDGPALYAIKHESFLDALELPNLFEDPVAFAKAELFRIPGWGRVARDYGLIPVERAQGAKALRDMVTAARKHAVSGRPLVIFPEGTRVPHGMRAPLRSGFAGLYKLLGLPVVPVAVDSGPLYHRLWKRPGTITFRFGEAIPPGLPRPEIEARVREAINVLNSPSYG